MQIEFWKYQGTGNDFIMLDNRNGQFDSLTLTNIQFLCDRRFGIGADGLIKINTKSGYDFEVEYYNSDGTKSFCGNGARCSVKFFYDLGNDFTTIRFWAIDGDHSAEIKGDVIALKMNDVSEIHSVQANFVLDTGSPHYVSLVNDLSGENIVEFGRAVRYSTMFNVKGINVNQMQELAENQITIQTYERGVEDETLSCGTGATACALVYAHLKDLHGKQLVDVNVKGGKLSVSFNRMKDDGSFKSIHLIGPAVQVFKGEINV